MMKIQICMAMIVAATVFSVRGETRRIDPKTEAEFQAFIMADAAYQTKQAEIEKLIQDEEKCALQLPIKGEAWQATARKYYQQGRSLVQNINRTPEQFKEVMSTTQAWQKVLLENRALYFQATDYQKAVLRTELAVTERSLIIFRISQTSSDPAVERYREAMQDLFVASSRKDVEKLPKVEGKGSPVYRAALYALEQYRNTPAAEKWNYINATMPFQAELNRLAIKQPEFQKCQAEQMIVLFENLLIAGRMNLQHPRLAAEQKLYQNQQSSLTEEERQKYKQLSAELKKIYQSDPQYTKNQKRQAEALRRQTELREKLVQTSDASIVKEYRMLLEMQKKVEAEKQKEKSSVPEPVNRCGAEQKLNFSGLFTHARYFQKDYDAREAAAFKRYMESENAPEPELAQALFKNPNIEKINEYIKRNDLKNAPGTEYFLRAQEIECDRNQTAVRKAMLPLFERLMTASIKDRDQAGLILTRLYYREDNYQEVATRCNRLAALPGVDPWVEEMLRGIADILMSWHARGHRFADQVSQDGWRIFAEKQKEGKKHLENAIRLAPDRFEPYFKLSGAPLPAAEALEYYRKGTEILPDSDQAVISLLNVMLPRWGGNAGMSLDLARACLRSPYRETRIPEYGLYGIFAAAYENENGGAWQRDFRNAPDLAKEVLRYLDEKKAKNPDGKIHRDAMAQRVSILYALGRYDEAMREYQALTPKEFRAAKKRLDMRLRRYTMLQNSIFAWVKFDQGLAAFTGVCGKELRAAENDYIAGRREQAIAAITEMLKREDIPGEQRRHLYYLCGNWMLDVPPSVCRSWNPEIDPWQLEFWLRRPPTVLTRMLELGLSPETPLRSGEPVMMLALERKLPTKLMLELLRKNPQMLGKQYTAKRLTMLAAAVRGGNEPALVEYMLKNGENSNAAGAKGGTALHEAVLKNSRELVKLLLANGAKRDMRNEAGETPIELAKKLKRDSLFEPK